MPRPKKTPANDPAPDAEGFDVPQMSSEISEPSPSPGENGGDDEDDGEEDSKPAQAYAIETPEQRRWMRAKRIAKAEEEQLRRLTRQYPVIARLVLDNQTLKKQLEKTN